MTSRASLLVVDVQYDFLSGGALAVPNGDAVVPVIQRLQELFDSVVVTQDWHPPNHLSFAENHPGEPEGSIVSIHGIRQRLWPRHCVQFSRGAEIAEVVRAGRVSHIVRKGSNPEIDSYSAFFDNGRRHSTDLDAYLRQQEIREVFVCGLATDFCVKASALDAIALGYRTSVVLDACRGVDESGTQAAVAEMDRAGVSVIGSALLLASSPR